MALQKTGLQFTNPEEETSFLPGVTESSLANAATGFKPRVQALLVGGPHRCKNIFPQDEELSTE